MLNMEKNYDIYEDDDSLQMMTSTNQQFHITQPLNQTSELANTRLISSNTSVSDDSTKVLFYFLLKLI